MPAPSKPVPPPAPKPGPGGNWGGVIHDRPIHHQDPPHVIPHRGPSQYDNPISRGHMGDAQQRWTDVGHRAPDAIRYLPNYQNRYRTEFHDRIYQRAPIVINYYNNEHYRYYYSGWYRHGFYGGYWYPVRPCYDVYNYFQYPLVFWIFYTAIDDANYWQYYYPGWSGQPVPAPAPGPAPAPPTPGPVASPVQPNPFAGVFYPTDTLRDLAMEISVMSDVAQANFRVAVTDFVSDLQDEISEQLAQSIQLNQYDVVVSHYQNLGNRAIVLEGFVDRGDGLQFSFKALLDLENPNETLTFVPKAQDPDGSDTTKLDQINQRIVNLGGDPYTADEEPAPGAPVPNP